MKFGYFCNTTNWNHKPYSQLLDETKEITTYCDQNNWDSIWYTEHHFNHEGMESCTNPLMMGVDAAARTKQISTKDIVDSYSGIRPLIEDFNQASKVTRDYIFDLNIIKKLPLLSIYGGKLTTYRKLAENVLLDLEKFLPKTKMGPWTHKKNLF